MNPSRLTEFILESTGISPAIQIKIFNSLLIIFLLWALRKFVIHLILKKFEEPQLRYRWQKSSIYLTVFIGFILIGRIWLEGIQSLATFIGIITAGLAIALQDLVKAVAGWMFILWRKPFSVGDRVEIGNIRGDVIDIRLFKFTLMEIGNWVAADQSTGRVVHLPNSMVLSEKIANYSRGFEFIWHEIPVLITFESNWKKAKQILTEIAEKHAAHLSKNAEKRLKEASKRYYIYYTALTPIVYTSVQDSGILLTIRYLIDPRKRRGSEQGIWEDILDEFAKCDDIDFAYPTQRLYNNVIEGKKGARANPEA